jgi:lipid A 4'-phosphatase
MSAYFSRNNVLIIDFNGADESGVPRTLFKPRTVGDAFVILFCLWWLLLAVFSAFPQIDLAVARMFFQQQQCVTLAATPKICGYFPYRDDPYLRALRQALFSLPCFVAVAICWVLFRCRQHHGATYKTATACNLKVALGSLIIGPLVLVNLRLKTFSGRPRPRQTDLFGGKWVTNRSFVSGQAASAGWLFCLVFIIPQPARSALALPIGAVAILTPALRVAFGGHYLPDAVLGWLSSLVVCSGLLALSQTAHSEKISKV